MSCSKADFVFFLLRKGVIMDQTPLVDKFGNLFKSLGKLLDTLNLFSEGLTELFDI